MTSANFLALNFIDNYNLQIIMLNLIKQHSVKLSFVFGFLLSVCLMTPGITYAQKKSHHQSNSAKITQKLPADTTVVSKNHQVTINGKKVPYEIILGTMPYYGKDGKPDASIFYVYYKRTDVKNKDKRPILISFNGGPGTGNLWMHLGYTSPKRLKISPNGWPVQPYGVEDNHHSVLDVTDIVYISPVNTGFSRMINDGKKDEFFGVQEDIDYLSDVVDLFLSRNHLWNSPKFLIGESYGTTRVSGMAGKLQGAHDIYLDGVILQGQCGMGEKGSPWFRKALKLPFYTATAWYYKQLPQDLQSQDLSDILPEVEDFTIHKYLPAVALGGSMSNDKKQAMAQKIARYSGLSKKFVLNNNLTVSPSSFWKELLRDQGKTTGRLDSRYVGIDSKNAGSRPEYSAELTSWENSFAPAINSYLRNDLGFKTDLQYYVFGPVYPWDRDHGTVYKMLRKAMEENPALQVLNQGGYYDGACDYFGAKYALWHMDPSGKLKDRIINKDYQSGHMLYVRQKTLKQGLNDLRKFITNSIPKEGQPIKYKDVDRVDLGK
jgi:carboxypeptidase C (cathepsin A)